MRTRSPGPAGVRGLSRRRHARRGRHRRPFRRSAGDHPRPLLTPTTVEAVMATIVSSLFIALDGVVEIDPAWHFPYFDANMGAAVGEDYGDVDALLIGRVTYDSFAGAWPEREAAGGEDAAYAASLGDVRKVVVTRGSQDLGWRNAEKL